MDWSEYFRQIAEVVKKKSKDQRTQVGAVIVGQDKEIVSTGYNSFPRGINDRISERQDRPEKYYWMEHAEQNAVINAARIGVSTKGASIYVTSGVPCTDCSRAIINAGIIKIHAYADTTGVNGLIWDDHIERSKQMLSEAGVEITYYPKIVTEGSYREGRQTCHYDESGNLLYVEDSDGRWSKWRYDNLGRETFFENSIGDWEEFSYRKNGEQIVVNSGDPQRLNQKEEVSNG